ncbi:MULTISPECIES: PD-(D/E)XK nuclease family protein [unclassified Legionella]|uniref:PD-(D/E)XK nuclease family protein n=1 Tax=unclassified Legionella TaxID=2622702 RepID=UPI001055E17F|nr:MULTISPECIES: PD-(D/E)XK nuclease family protein [unclassified Legionella]MDI9818106.1 PD-(D/E)XK nuclease family protein [Legionella sp. PL877]
MITDKKELLTLMHEGATVITPNNRLSQELLRDFFKAASAKVKEKPICLPYTAFLIDSFKKFCFQHPEKSHPLVLTPQQLRYLWRQILTGKMSINTGLLNAVDEAWTRCNLWLLDLNHPSFSYTSQTRQFQQWALQLQQQLVQLEAITDAQLVPYLCAQTTSLTGTFIWACFDDYTPQQKKLQQYLNSQGCIIRHYDLAKQTASLCQYKAEDEENEYEQLIFWLKECLAKNETSIGVIVPELETKSAALTRRLQQHFLPEEFNISLGKPLADFPLVAHALNWLDFDDETLSAHQARLLLHSPYLGHSQTEMLARAQYMEDSTLLQELRFEYSTFIEELEVKTPKLATLLKKITSYPQQASVQTWIREFTARLKVLGFPGEYPLNSSTYQCYQRFLLLFDELKQLALITPSMNKKEAIAALRELAESAIFQPEKFPAPIQILGLLEASGCTFESLWIMGLTDQCLPGSIRPSAFIPLSLQQEQSMPYTSNARELELAEKSVNRFFNSSRHCVLSYPQFSGDKPNMPSPFVTNLAELPSQQLPASSEKPKLEPLLEDYLLPMSDNEKITGGTSILANQAKCPFRAFSAHRLHAKATSDITMGPNAKDRGQLIHKVMELLWGFLKSQQHLLSLNSQQLDNHIESAIKKSLEPIVNQRKFSFSTLIQEVEIERLKRLVHACLDWERQRTPFEVIALEQDFTVQLSGIEFHVRVDRMDKVEQGQMWVIDYKSSIPQSTPWNEERPKEPQLLLYALLDETINTLLFAQLKAGQFACKGLSEEKTSIAGISALKKDQNWSVCRENWRSLLNELANEFTQGYCPPQPGNLTICRQCDHQNLCRRFAIHAQEE